MSNDRAAQHMPVIVSIIVALMLTMVPMPDAISPFRPDWVALIMIFWAIGVPRSYSVGIAWIVGLVLDATHGTLLGQHALALSLIVYIAVKFHLLMRVFPLIQLTATVFALLALYQFLLFWINGVAGVAAPSISYWGPVLSGTVIWPVLFTFLTSVRYRVRMRG
jgi:rod shape-determining protein MreD